MTKTHNTNSIIRFYYTAGPPDDIQLNAAFERLQVPVGLLYTFLFSFTIGRTFVCCQMLLVAFDC